MARTNIGNLSVVVAPITDSDLDTAAAIQASKCQFPFKATANFGLAIGATPVTKEEVKYVADGPGTLNPTFRARVGVPGSSASVTVDLKKNGTSILSGGTPITLTNATSAGVVQNATIVTRSFVQGDEFSVSLVTSTTTGMSDVTAIFSGYENALPT